MAAARVRAIALVASWHACCTQNDDGWQHTGIYGSPALQLSEGGAATIGELTADFSFAYLKELFLSSKMRWIASGQQRSMDEVMVEQAQTLREQMTSAQALIAPPEHPDNQETTAGRARMMRHIIMDS